MRIQDTREEFEDRRHYHYHFIIDLDNYGDSMRYATVTPRLLPGETFFGIIIPDNLKDIIHYIYPSMVNILVHMVAEGRRIIINWYYVG